MSDLISREDVLEFEEYVGEPATWDKPYPKGDLYVKSEIYDTVKDKKPLVRMVFQYPEIENAHKRAKRGGEQE